MSIAHGIAHMKIGLYNVRFDWRYRQELYAWSSVGWLKYEGVNARNVNNNKNITMSRCEFFMMIVRDTIFADVQKKKSMTHPTLYLFCSPDRIESDSDLWDDTVEVKWKEKERKPLSSSHVMMRLGRNILLEMGGGALPRVGSIMLSRSYDI